ncbi:MAG: hypothetical protein ACLGRW_18490 [Acidobacteriota bacterium]
MSRSFLSDGMRATLQSAARASRRAILRRAAILCVTALLLTTGGAAQVITIDTNGKAAVPANAPVDRRFAQITPTKITLSKEPLDGKTKMELIRFLEAEHGFAMRPLPSGHKGLTLAANGTLHPAGEAYLNMAISEGVCAKPGDSVVITDVKFSQSKMVIDLNGGPDFKHRFLRHISIGMDPTMTNSVVPDEGIPRGARITLTFKERVPRMTGAQVEDLLSPLIEFKVKSPIQAFTDTLPLPLKNAILDHQVLVGMTTDMVMFAKGQPWKKTRETVGLAPLEVWIFGKPPDPTDFVTINGNRVIKVEIARVGKPLEVFTQDVVTPMLMTNGSSSPVLAAESNTHIIREGDVQRDPNKEAPAPPPTLRNPGEKLPTDGSKSSRVGVMKPVQFPKEDQQQPQLGANPDGVPQAPPKSGGTAAPANSAPPAPAQPAPAAAAAPESSQPAPAADSNQQR